MHKLILASLINYDWLDRNDVLMESNHRHHILHHAFITELRNIIGTQSDRPEN